MNTEQYGENDFSEEDADEVMEDEDIPFGSSQGLREAYEELLQQKIWMEDAMIELFIRSVADATHRTWTLSSDYIDSLRHFLKLLTVEEMSEAMQIAMRKLHDRKAPEIFKYFCGVCHKKIGAMDTSPEGATYRDVRRHYLGKGKTKFLKTWRLRQLCKRYSPEVLKEAIDIAFSEPQTNYWQAFYEQLSAITGYDVEE